MTLEIDQVSNSLAPPLRGQAGVASAPSAAPRIPAGPTALGMLRNGLAARGLGLVAGRLEARRRGVFGILMYHRVVPAPKGFRAPTWNVAPARFRAQLEGLLKLGYRPRALGDILARHQAGEPIEPKAFVITFDDGYENVYRHAFPVLREHGVPATVFLATGYLDCREPFPFDDWPDKDRLGVPAETWRPLATAQCEEMQASGLIELGSHTHLHADFRGRPGALCHDLADSLDVLRSRFGLSRPSFATPFGRGCRKLDGPELSEAARQAGVACALTTDSELIGPGDDPFDWGRFPALGTDSAASLAAKLNGWYSLAQGAWRRLRRRAGTPARRPGDMANARLAIR